MRDLRLVPAAWSWVCSTRLATRRFPLPPAALLAGSSSASRPRFLLHLRSVAATWRREPGAEPRKHKHPGPPRRRSVGLSPRPRARADTHLPRDSGPSSAEAGEPLVCPAVSWKVEPVTLRPVQALG